MQTATLLFNYGDRYRGDWIRRKQEYDRPTPSGLIALIALTLSCATCAAP